LLELIWGKQRWRYMRHLFEELLAEIQRASPIAAETLRPGLPPDRVKEKLAKVPFQISPDAVALYSWADGATAGLELLPGAYFITLDEALLHFELEHQMKDQLQAVFFEPYFDSFRFLSDLSDGGYSFGRTDSPSEGHIVRLCIHAPWRLAFRDLTAVLKTSIECYRSRVISPVSNTVDFKAYYELAARMNPGMEYWTAPGD
jgi:hypothetical protein